MDKINPPNAEEKTSLLLDAEKNTKNNYKQRWRTSYEKGKVLGQGGNAVVYSVKDKNGKEFALKSLTNENDAKKKRFLSEIDIMSQHSPTIKGMIPILDYSKEDLWYTMPIAEPIADHIKKNKCSFDEIIIGIIQIAEVLSQLHDKGISHRDIKPDNIYFYNNAFYIGDFGLVDFPENNGSLTETNHSLGAIFTLAPEMKRNPKIADGRKADVYSLAKTMWILLSGNEKGFDGQYNPFDKTESLRLMDRYKHDHLVELEDLLSTATSNDPDKRPSMKDFQTGLRRFEWIRNNSEAAWKSDWNSLERVLFEGGEPEQMSWRGTESIKNALNTMTSTPVFNHMLLPGGGGVDLSRVDSTMENDRLVLYCDYSSPMIIHPKSLTFVHFGKNDYWNYFFLECWNDKPLFRKKDSCSEDLIEDYPGHYVENQSFQYGVYDYDSGKPLPKKARRVERYYCGNFLIVLKNGYYNRIGETYDGRQGNVDPDTFYKYCRFLRLSFLILRIKGEAEEDILRRESFGQNPFKVCKKEDKAEKRDNLKEIPLDYFDSREEYLNFSCVASRNKTSQKEPLFFYLSFERPHQNQLMGEDLTVICKDGTLKRIQRNQVKEFAMLFYNRNVAIRAWKRSEAIVNDKITELGFRKPPLTQYVKLDFQKDGTPTHLFSEDDVTKAMRDADDRVNNALVVDGDGNAIVLSDFAPIELELYPVHLESWGSGTVNVGKYADLSDARIIYLNALLSWKNYLLSGQSQYNDLFETGLNEEKLRSEIQNLYRANPNQ